MVLASGKLCALQETVEFVLFILILLPRQMKFGSARISPQDRTADEIGAYQVSPATN